MSTGQFIRLSVLAILTLCSVVVLGIVLLSPVPPAPDEPEAQRQIHRRDDAKIPYESIG